MKENKTIVNQVESDSELADLIRVGHLRPTKARIAILKIFTKDVNHLSCDQIVKYLTLTTKLGQATIYQNIKILAEHNLLTSFKGPDGVLFQRSKQQHHHHLICTKCGTITDVLVKGHCDVLTPKPFDENKSINNWNITNRIVEFFGVCPECTNN